MQNENMPTEGQNSTKLEAESALRDAACCASLIPFGTDLTNVAEENSRAVDELLATGQFLVDVGKNVVPPESLEEGVPVRWTNPIPIASSEPNGDNGSSESRVVGAILQCADERVLVGSGLVSKGRIKGNDDKVNPLLSEVGDFVSSHNGVGDSSIILHNA
jgi:hypothetical protein